MPMLCPAPTAVRYSLVPMLRCHALCSAAFDKASVCSQHTGDRVLDTSARADPLYVLRTRLVPVIGSNAFSHASSSCCITSNSYMHCMQLRGLGDSAFLLALLLCFSAVTYSDALHVP
jgi:hypothetical protein